MCRRPATLRSNAGAQSDELVIMRHAHELERIRETVRCTFAAQGLDSLEDFAEAIMIRDGHYCGRLFTCGGLRAVWFVEENRLKFFGRNHELLLSQPAGHEPPSEDVAA
jgi:hypothetical protein